MSCLGNGPGTPLSQLVEACKSAVIIGVNEHTVGYESIRQYIASRESGDITPELEAQIIAMEAAGRCVEVQAYPHTPIGFHWACGADIDETIARVLTMVLAGDSQ